MTGNHRPEGVLLLSEPADAASCSLLDVAPTVYGALGVPGPPMEGRALTGEPTAAAVAGEYAPQRAPYAPEEEAAVEQRLRDLGYFE